MKAEPIQIPPTPEVLAVCEVVDLVVERYLKTLGRRRLGLERFESEIEAYTMLKLMLRHAEGVLLLARHDLVLLPSALVTSRALFEASVRCRWMLKPIDPFEREVRWLAHFRSAEEQWSKLAKSKYILEEARAQAADSEAVYRRFGDGIADLLRKEGNLPLKNPPNLWEMLKELDEPHLYLRYILLSAYTHSNLEAGSLYRENLGSAKQYGEFISGRDWHLPLEVSFKSFFTAARSFLEAVDADVAFFDSADLAAKGDVLLNALNSSKGANH